MFLGFAFRIFWSSDILLRFGFGIVILPIEDLNSSNLAEA
jgi:hypothetical protein